MGPTGKLPSELHLPVLLSEVIDFLRPQRGGTFIDCTVGLGGHAEAILIASSATLLLGLDRDPDTLGLARKRLARFGERVRLAHANFSRIAEVARDERVANVRGILADLGVSSVHLDQPERGFSFADDAPLDMRMDRTEPKTAADLVNELPERELADLIFEYGEERGSRKIARAIVRERQAEPILTTRRLADVVVRALNVRGHWRIHPATRTFQALRISVNSELDALEAFVPAATNLLDAGGRLAIISFHSLEDRIVKRAFRRESGACICEPRLSTARRVEGSGSTQVVCERCGARTTVRVLTRKPIRPSAMEIRANPRSRSASMRVCEKL